MARLSLALSYMFSQAVFAYNCSLYTNKFLLIFKIMESADLALFNSECLFCHFWPSVKGSNIFTGPAGPVNLKFTGPYEHLLVWASGPVLSDSLC